MGIVRVKAMIKNFNKMTQFYKRSRKMPLDDKYSSSPTRKEKVPNKFQTNKNIKKVAMIAS